MGIEEYANKKLKELERNIQEEAKRKKEAERENFELGQRNLENEEKLKEVLR